MILHACMQYSDVVEAHATVQIHTGNYYYYYYY